jgi:hypothetical protein
MKLIEVARASRVIIAATICVVAGSANAQQIESVPEGASWRVRYAPSATPLIRQSTARPIPMRLPSKVIANTPGMTSAALTVALQTTHVTMPNFVIKGDALQNIIAYILSLKEKN